MMKTDSEVFWSGVPCWLHWLAIRGLTVMNKLMIGDVIDSSVEWVLDSFGKNLDAFSDRIDVFVRGLNSVLEFLPWWVLILLVAAIAMKASCWKLALGSALGPGLIYKLA